MTIGRIAATIALVVLAHAAPAAAQDEITAEEIDQAIERGVESLWAGQADDGSWGTMGEPGEFHYYVSGHDVCAMMGLAFAGVSPNDERLRKGLKVILEAELNKTYAYAVRTIALSRLYPSLKGDLQKATKRRLAMDVEWLIDAQYEEGDWNYTGTGGGDLSNTQMAVLALREASAIFQELPPDVWKRVMKRYLDIQRDDGGWNYGTRSSVHANMASYGSMTAAGVASLMICRDELFPASGCPCRGNQSPRRVTVADQAIERGIDWLAKNFVADENPGRGAYFLYWAFSCQRVGMASGIKYFGTHDWYRELTRQVLDHQGRDGGWGRPSETALAIAFLVKGRAPILMNKLRFKGEWNNHPNDARYLAWYVGKQKEQPFQWQVVGLDVPAAELHDSPILYISAETPIEFADDTQKRKLREFTDSGGTILFEASCGNRQASLWWDQLVKELWPEWELERIGRDHPLWTADTEIRGRLPNLEGLSDGLRTFLVTSKADISCPWAVRALPSRHDLFNLGVNLYRYATDRTPIRSRLADRPVGEAGVYADAEIAAGGKDRIEVVRVKHAGDWYLGRNYAPWKVLGEALSEKTGLAITVGEPMPVGGDVPPETDLIYVSGRTGVDLGADGVAWLRQTASDGRTLLVEAVMGDKRFDAAWRKLASEAGLELKSLPADDPLLSGELPGTATGYAIDKVDFTYALRGERIGRPEPVLLGIYDGERRIGVYSPFDLLYAQTGYEAYDSRGYAAEDARALVTNLVLSQTIEGTPIAPADDDPAEETGP